ncbi:MAG: single-stranded DNA-binding protein [Anaerolineales bacterium]
MSRGLNKVMIIGNLGRDPEMRHTGSGKAVTNFTVGVTRHWQSADGDRREETEWFNVVSWGGLAEVCEQHLRQGDRVYIEGRLHTRTWQDNAGAAKKATEVVAQELVMLGDGPKKTVEFGS